MCNAEQFLPLDSHLSRSHQVKHHAYTAEEDMFAHDEIYILIQAYTKDQNECQKCRRPLILLKRSQADFFIFDAKFHVNSTLLT